MSKVTKKTISFLMVAVLAFAMYVPASAQGEFLGTDEDVTGYIIPDDEENRERVVIFPVQIGDGSMNDYPLIFSITAANVTTLLPSSYGGKSFYINDLPYYAENLILRATLHHSLEDYEADGNSLWPDLDDEVIAGVCYYWYNNMSGQGEYASVFLLSYKEEQLGETLQCTFSIADYLDPNVEYFTYVKNHYCSGYVYGNVYLYYD